MTTEEYVSRGALLRQREALARDVVTAAIRDGLYPEDDNFRSFIALHQRTLDDLSDLDREFGHLS